VAVHTVIPDTVVRCATISGRPDARRPGAARSAYTVSRVVKVRLDSLLHQRGLFSSRSRAAGAISAGEVRVAATGERATKPGQMVCDDLEVAVEDAPRFVSRGGVKLANALSALGVDPRGRRCIDVGASTGGFTDCLLQRGAEHVIALDVADGELHASLRQDPRVTAIERVNARELRPGDLPYAPDLVVADVSFISLTKVLPAVLACAAPRFDALAMVKPQFEVGRKRVGSGGVVREAADRRDAFVTVARAVRDEAGASVLGFAPSGLPGPKGNRETFVWLAEAGRAGALDDAAIEAAAARADEHGAREGAGPTAASGGGPE
jgi:23S rRNA (cytidine1920-2'-O)/16S rRNA (cytidine1409-2'-O)-methyltransferase